jgi:uridine phosphorylase
MMLSKCIPILEFDDETNAIINPARKNIDVNMPKRCVLTFFKEVVEKYSKMVGTEKVISFKWENGDIQVYKMKYDEKEIAFCHLHVGAPIAVGIFEDIIGYGGKSFIVCGGCGVLDDIELGDVLIPKSAIRDEGTSYHYKKASREVKIGENGISHIEKVLNNRNIRYRECKIWTTDAYFRETKDKINARKREGCLCVDMECSALATVAEYRNVEFAQFVYSGDSILGENYDDRNWTNAISVREKMFLLAIEACSKYE